MNRTPSGIERINALLHWAEDAVLVLLLLGMIGFAVTQIILRNFFGFSITWADILVRFLVLWIALFGAMAAGRQNKHINIDVITRYLPERVRHGVNAIVELITAGVCAVVGVYSITFVQMEFEYGGKAFADVPSWICTTIIPFAFMIIALRFLFLSITDFIRIVKPAS